MISLRCVTTATPQSPQKKRDVLRDPLTTAKVVSIVLKERIYLATTSAGMDYANRTVITNKWDNRHIGAFGKSRYPV